MATGRAGSGASRAGAGPPGKGDGPRGSLDYFEVLKQVKRSPAERNLWMLVSREPYLYDRMSRLLIEAVVPDLREFNLAVIQCVNKPEEAAWSCLRHALSEIEELPIGGQQRLVILRDVHHLPEAACNRLAASLSDLPPSTVLFLSGHPSSAERATSGYNPRAETGEGEAAPQAPTVDRDDDAQKKAKAYRCLMETVAACGGLANGTLRPEDRAAWVGRVFDKELGVSVPADVLQFFVERVGDDMYSLLHEARKVGCYVGQRAKVTVDDVRQVVSPNPTHQVWELSDAISRREAGRALQVLTDMLGLGKGDDEVFLILGYLGSHYRNLLRVKALHDRRESPAGAMRLLKARSEWKVKKDMELASRLSDSDLARTLDSLLRTDQAIKRGANGRQALELAIVGLCESRVRRP